MIKPEEFSCFTDTGYPVFKYFMKDNYLTGLKARSFVLFKDGKPFNDFYIEDKYLKFRTFDKTAVYEIEGYHFDSLAEFKFYDMVSVDPDVERIEFNPSWNLTPNTDDKRLKVTYVADFKITMKNGRIRYIDVKGVKTKVYQTKRKILFDRYGIEIEEVGAKNLK